MKEAVIIKSFPSGITLRLNREIPFEKLLEEIGFKFSEARNFFGNANMALSLEGRQVSGTEELLIVEAIHSSCNLHILCIVERDETTGRDFAKALADLEKKNTGEEESQFFKGDLKDGDILETENSMILLGNVSPGSAVYSARNIIILGGLYGEACADGFVAALEMKPEKIKIGDFKYRPRSKKSKWPGRITLKVQPKIAYVKNNRITFESLTKDFLSAF